MAGHIRIELAKVIKRDLGITVRPDNLERNMNNSRYHDQFSWETTGVKDGVSFTFGCSESMTECVRKGVAMLDNGFEITAK